MYMYTGPYRYTYTCISRSACTYALYVCVYITSINTHAYSTEAPKLSAHSSRHFHCCTCLIGSQGVAFPTGALVVRLTILSFLTCLKENRHVVNTLDPNQYKGAKPVRPCKWPPKGQRCLRIARRPFGRFAQASNPDLRTCGRRSWSSP